MRTWLLRGAGGLIAAGLVFATVPRQSAEPTVSAECRGLDDSGLDSNRQTRFATGTAAELLAAAPSDVWIRNRLNSIAGVSGGPLEDPRAPRCHPELLELGAPVFVRKYPGVTGTWLVPVRYHGQTLETLFVSRDADGMGGLGMSQGGEIPMASEASARSAATVTDDPIDSAELVFIKLSCGTDVVAWRLVRRSGTPVYYASQYQASGVTFMLLREDEVRFPSSGRPPSAFAKLSLAC
jgi:hypothetical protein